MSNVLSIRLKIISQFFITSFDLLLISGFVNLENNGKPEIV